MELTDEKRSVMLTPRDFEEANLKETAKTIAHNSSNFYVVAPELAQMKRLSDLIELLSQSLSTGSAALTGAKICYEIEFPQRMPVSYIMDDAEEKPAACWSSVLNALTLKEDGTLAYPCQIIVDDTLRTETDDAEQEAAQAKEQREQANRLVAEIFQQAVFLGLMNLDIKKRSENRLYQQKKRFRASYDSLVAGASTFEQTLTTAEASASDEGITRQEKLIETLAELKTSLRSAAERPLKIAVMGTKKAGKSVVVNCLLGAEYAPTSSELPTPNRIDYIPERRQDISLEYKGETRTFDSVKGIHDFIEKAFKDAQQETGEKAGLADMVIHYPQQGMDSCVIMDTPGPNYAGAGEEHARIARECIKEADICIFVMNYSNYLTHDEEKFLKEIRTYFEEQGKFYSFFVAINRIDERYAAEVEKSTTRVIDYIRGRLEALGYQGVLAFGTSALSFYYLQSVRAIAQTEGMNGVLGYADIRDLKKKHKEEMTKLSFIAGMYDHLEDFHGIEDATDTAVEAMSGIPQLKAHTYYVGRQKADTELVNHAIGSIDAKYAIIRNALLIDELLKLQHLSADKKGKIQNALNEVQDGFTEDTVDLKDFRKQQEDFVVAGMIAKFEQDLDDNIGNSRAELEENLSGLVDDTTWKEADFQGDFHTEKWDEFFQAVEDFAKGFNANMNTLGLDIARDMADRMQGAFSGKIHKMQKHIKTRMERFQDAVQEASSEAAEVLAKYELPTIEQNFVLPPPDEFVINVDDIRGEMEDIGQDSMREKERTYRLSSRRGLFGNILHPIDWLLDNTGTEIVEVFDQDACKVKLKDWCMSTLNPLIEEQREVIIATERAGLEHCFQNFNDGTQEFLKNYSTIFNDMKRDLEMALSGAVELEAALKKDVETFRVLAQAFDEAFARTWEGVRDGKR